MITYAIESICLIWCLKKFIILFVKKMKFNQLNVYLADLEYSDVLVDQNLEDILNNFHDIEHISAKKSFSSEFPDDFQITKGE